MKKKKIIILGCSGSIGSTTVNVLRSNKEYFEVVGVSAHTNESKLLKFAEFFNVKNVCLSGRESTYAQINYQGFDALIDMIKNTEADVVLNGIAGSAGLLPSIATLESGKNLALANKETIVMAGKLIKELAKKNNANILPVDSEHSAIWQLTKHIKKEYISEIILTASGGAFRNLPVSSLENVSVTAALAHPTWEMGPKITIDSATMANKGLEVIEASFLFGLPAEKIKIVLHPKSYVHSLVRTIDGYLYSQISLPDMSVPIQNALCWPDFIPANYAHLSLPGVKLEFSEMDNKKYPIVRLAYNALKKNGAYPLAFNAANEVAVAAFIDGLIKFTDISKIVEDCLQKEWPTKVDTFEHVYKLDKEIRKSSLKILERYKNH